MIGLSLRGEHQHAQRQRDFCFCNAHSFPLNPCFVLCLSRSHKSTVGGKEEKVLIYNEKELNKTVDIVYPVQCCCSPDRCVAPPPGDIPSAIGIFLKLWDMPRCPGAR
ncbi:hypothetical protein FML27_05375 [Klebsiella grimontii]|nr:hypothetical protein [Klebsiella grimontii]